MSSLRDDFAYLNYDVKLTAEGLNIGEIRLANAGDSITFFNDTDASQTFTDTDGLWGRSDDRMVLPPATSGRVPVVGVEGKRDYEVDIGLTPRTGATPGDGIPLKIKMGGGGWGHRSRARHT